jgi:hypothetical protein
VYHLTRMRPALSAATLILFATGCGSERDANAPRPATSPPERKAARVSGLGSVAASKAYVGATRLTTLDQNPATILRIPGYGALSVTCTAQGRPRMTFTLVANTSTTVVSVRAGRTTIGSRVEPGAAFSAPLGPTRVAQQTWQLSRSDPVSVESATIVVTSMSARSMTGGNDCFAAAQAVITTARG